MKSGGWTEVVFHHLGWAERPMIPPVGMTISFGRTEREGWLLSATDAEEITAVPFVIPSISTCLRQVEGEMNDIHGIVARTTKFKESATLPFVIPSEPGFPATQHWTAPRVRLSVRKGA